MKNSILSAVVSLFLIPNFYAQEKDITSSLYETYNTYKETTLNTRRVKHHELQPLIAAYSANPGFKVKKVGMSIEGRNLSLISIGSGATDVFFVVANAWERTYGNSGDF